MEKEFVIYSLALRMKKLGYNGSCFAFYQVENFEEKPCGVDDRDEYIRTGFATCKNSEIPEQMGGMFIIWKIKFLKVMLHLKS